MASWWLIVRCLIVTYRWFIVDGPIKSHVLLITWLHKVTWQTENVSFSRRLMVTKICRVLTVMKLHKFDHVTTWGQVTNWKLNTSSSTRSIPQHLAEWWRRTLWPCSLVRSQEKFKTKIWIYLPKLTHAKNVKTGILENKLTRKLISFRQSNLFLKSSLIKSLSLTKIYSMILTQFQAMLQFYTHLKHQKTRDQGA